MEFFSNDCAPKIIRKFQNIELKMFYIYVYNCATNEDHLDRMSDDSAIDKNDLCDSFHRTLDI